MDTRYSRVSLHAQPLSEQLRDVSAAIRSRPDDALLRVHLAQLCMLMGNWERAIIQLQTLAQFDASSIPMAQTYREAIHCECVREQVFDGALTAPCLGEPAAWLAPLTEALKRRCTGDDALADELCDQACAEARETPFRVDGDDTAWLADADSRLGPVCEIILDGTYYWLPFESIHALELAPPTDLRDLVWAPATLTLRNQGQHSVLLPSRYPYSYCQGDDRLTRASLTTWNKIGADAWAGFGQRSWISNRGDHPMLAVTRIECLGSMAADT